MSLYPELKRRGVLKVGAAYLVVAWVIVQVASIAFPAFEAPLWALRVFILIAMLGFPLALVMAWVLEVTPDGLRHEPAPLGNKRVFLTAAGLTALALAWYFVGQPALRSATTPAPVAAPVPVSPQAPDPGAATASDSKSKPAPLFKSIAVLPFVDMSQGKDQEYFSDGITEEILNALTGIEGLKVAGRTSSFHFKGRNESLQAIGAALGVAHVLEGSVRKQGDHVRITAQLIKVDDGFHLWSENYDRKLDDIFVIQDEISLAIATALSSRLMEERAKPLDASVDADAYDVYLRARQMLARRTGEDILQAAALFEAATRLDGDFDLAHSGRARALSLAGAYVGETEGGDRPAQAQRAAERALALDPDNAEAHSSLAYLHLSYLWRWDDGLRATERSVALAPNDAEIANFAGDAYRVLADFERARDWENRALELNPLFAVNHSDLGWLLLTERRCREALVPLQQALEVDPDYWPSLFWLGRAQLCLGEIDAAAATVERFARINPRSPFLLDLRAHVAIRANRSEDARSALAELLGRARDGESVHYWIALIQARLGEHEAAAQSLEQAYRLHDPYFAFDELFLLPEDWPDHPAIRAALDKPDLNALYEIRRRNLAKTPRSPLP